MLETLRADFARIPELLALPEPDQPDPEPVAAEPVAPPPPAAGPPAPPAIEPETDPSQLGLF
jgi:DNA polymerase